MFILDVFFLIVSASFGWELLRMCTVELLDYVQFILVPHLFLALLVLLALIPSPIKIKVNK